MIAGIYRINRPAERNNFEECGIKHNRQMLWHGTHTAHMISILKHGLKMDARNARQTGSSLGNVSLASFIDSYFHIKIHYEISGVPQ